MQWENDKLLIMGNLSFSQSVIYCFGEFSTLLIKFETLVCKLFQFGRVLNLRKRAFKNMLEEKMLFDPLPQDERF